MKCSKDRKFNLPTMGLPLSRTQNKHWHMNLWFIAITSGMGCNEVREAEFLNYCDTLDMEQYKNPLLWIAPQDMI